MKTFKFLTAFFAVLMMTANLTSCKDDNDAPTNKLDKITFGEIVGTWVTDDGSNDYILVASSTNPSNFGINRMICYWGGTFTNMGVPVFSFDKNKGYYTWGTSLELNFTAYNAKAGKMTVYNTQKRQTKNFRLTQGNMAIIKNPNNTQYKNATISVYSATNQNTPVYTANIGEVSFHGSSMPFWTGGKKAIVKATMQDYYSGETVTATWTDLEPNKFYTLDL